MKGEVDWDIAHADWTPAFAELVHAGNQMKQKE